jgi:hypothetical protein
MDSGSGDHPTRVAGLPHSDTHGSKPDCDSPWRFAAYRVLRRHSVPRHPPRALRSLNQENLTQLTSQCSLSNRYDCSYNGVAQRKQQTTPLHIRCIPTIHTKRYVVVKVRATHPGRPGERKQTGGFNFHCRITAERILPRNWKTVKAGTRDYPNGQ